MFTDGEEQTMDFLYPGWKKKALTFSYDDGQIYDRRLVEIFNRYGLKGTFHLNSGTVGKPGFVESRELKNSMKGMRLPVMVWSTGMYCSLRPRRSVGG